MSCACVHVRLAYQFARGHSAECGLMGCRRHRPRAASGGCAERRFARGAGARCGCDSVCGYRGRVRAETPQSSRRRRGRTLALRALGRPASRHRTTPRTPSARPSQQPWTRCVTGVEGEGAAAGGAGGRARSGREREPCGGGGAAWRRCLGQKPCGFFFFFDCGRARARAPPRAWGARPARTPRREAPPAAPPRSEGRRDRPSSSGLVADGAVARVPGVRRGGRAPRGRGRARGSVPFFPFRCARPSRAPAAGCAARSACRATRVGAPPAWRQTPLGRDRFRAPRGAATPHHARWCCAGSARRSARQRSQATRCAARAAAERARQPRRGALAGRWACATLAGASC